MPASCGLGTALRTRQSFARPSHPLRPAPPATSLCRVIYLEDNDIVHMKGGEYTVFNWSDVDSPSVEVRRTIQTLTMEVSQIMKVRLPAGGVDLHLGRHGVPASVVCHPWRRKSAAEHFQCAAPDAVTLHRLPHPGAAQGGYTHFMEKEIFEQPETIAQTMQGRVKITPLSPMKYAVPGIDPYLMPRVRMGGLVDHVSVSAGRWLAGCGRVGAGQAHGTVCSARWCAVGLSPVCITQDNSPA